MLGDQKFVPENSEIHACNFVRFRGSMYASFVPHFAMIGPSVAEIWSFAIFQVGDRPPSWIFFESSKIRILTAGTVLKLRVRHPAKFCASRSNRCGDIWPFFDFQDGGRPLRPPTKIYDTTTISVSEN